SPDGSMMGCHAPWSWGFSLEAMLNGEESELETIRHADLVEDVREVVLDRLDADRELLRNLGVRIATGDGQHDFQLTRSQARGGPSGLRPGRGRQGAHHVDQPPHALAPHPVLAGHDGADALEQCRAWIVLHDDTAGSQLQCVDHVGIADLCREEQRSSGRHRDRELVEYVQTGDDRDREIEQQDIGPELAHERHRLAAVTRFGDHVKRGIRREELAQCIAEEPMTIRYHDRRLPSCARRRLVGRRGRFLETWRPLRTRCCCEPNSARLAAFYLWTWLQAHVLRL